jgi:hypothetical protein
VKLEEERLIEMGIALECVKKYILANDKAWEL